MSSPKSIYREFPNVSRLLEEKFLCRRKERKISQTALADKAGLTRNCIQQMECHEHLPLHSTMFKLCQALEFSKEESDEFWSRYQVAYAMDIALQETSSGYM